MTVTLEFLTPAEAGRIIGVSKSTLAKWRCYGSGPRYTLAGSRVRYSSEALTTWMLSRERVSTSDRSPSARDFRSDDRPASIQPGDKR